MSSCLPLYGDFNDIDDDGLLHVLASAARPGESRWVMDDEGNCARAIVVEQRHDVALLRIDWETWLPGDTDGVLDGEGVLSMETLKEAVRGHVGMRVHGRWAQPLVSFDVATLGLVATNAASEHALTHAG